MPFNRFDRSSFGSRPSLILGLLRVSDLVNSHCDGGREEWREGVAGETDILLESDVLLRIAG